MRLSTSKPAPSGRSHRHIGRYNPRPVALALACELTCQYQADRILHITVIQGTSEGFANRQAAPPNIS